MNTVIIVLLSIAILFFLLSFLQKNRVQVIENELEELSLKFLEENYQLKKRMKVLEEELLLDDAIFLKGSSQREKKEINQILMNQVIALYHQGLDYEQIAKQSSLSLAEVTQILDAYEQ